MINHFTVILFLVMLLLLLSFFLIPYQKRNVDFIPINNRIKDQLKFNITDGSQVAICGKITTSAIPII